MRTIKSATTKPTSKSAAKVAASKVATKTVAKVAKAASVKKVSKIPNQAASKAGVEVSKADIVLAAVTAAFADKNNESPRDTVVKMCQNELDMKPTTAATYFSNAMRKLLTAEHKAALELLEKNKPVWSAFKANAQNVVTSVGLFTSATSANEFNALYRHSGVVKGVVEVDEVVNVKKSRKTA